MKDHIHDAAAILGVILVALALGAIYRPLGVLVIGAGMAAWAWIAARTEALEASQKRREDARKRAEGLLA